MQDLPANVRDILDFREPVLTEEASKREWVRLIRLFKQDFTARQPGKALGLSYLPVLKGFQITRRAIVTQDQALPLFLEEMTAKAASLAGEPRGRQRQGASLNRLVFHQGKLWTGPGGRASGPSASRNPTFISANPDFRNLDLGSPFWEKVRV
jgi:hypothetical protein